MCYPTFKMGNVKCRTLYKMRQKISSVLERNLVARSHDVYTSIIIRYHFTGRERFYVNLIPPTTIKRVQGFMQSSRYFPAI